MVGGRTRARGGVLRRLPGVLAVAGVLLLALAPPFLHHPGLGAGAPTEAGEHPDHAVHAVRHHDDAGHEAPPEGLGRPHCPLCTSATTFLLPERAGLAALLRSEPAPYRLQPHASPVAAAIVRGPRQPRAPPRLV
jgi:hypothetical protein